MKDITKETKDEMKRLSQEWGQVCFLLEDGELMVWHHYQFQIPRPKTIACYSHDFGFERIIERRYAPNFNCTNCGWEGNYDELIQKVSGERCPSCNTDEFLTENL